ncbi:MAG TPA: hypothetical protein VFR66_18775 [Burkholderiales bacterium]|nr:hypothetical protein [Burkholderiales bacterium]
MKATLAAVLAALFGLLALSAHAAPLPQSGVQPLDIQAPPAADDDKDKDKEKDKKDG